MDVFSAIHRSSGEKELAAFAVSEEWFLAASSDIFGYRMKLRDYSRIFAINLMSFILALLVENFLFIFRSILLYKYFKVWSCVVRSWIKLISVFNLFWSKQSAIVMPLLLPFNIAVSGSFVQVFFVFLFWSSLRLVSEGHIIIMDRIFRFYPRSFNDLQTAETLQHHNWILM